MAASNAIVCGMHCLLARQNVSKSHCSSDPRWPCRGRLPRPASFFRLRPAKRGRVLVRQRASSRECAKYEGSLKRHITSLHPTRTADYELALMDKPLKATKVPKLSSFFGPSSRQPLPIRQPLGWNQLGGFDCG